MFSLINVGERAGIGLCDVFSTWKAYGYKEPELVESVEPDRITITLEIEVSDITTGNVANNVANVANIVANVANNVANVANNVANVANNVAKDGDDVANDRNVVADSRELSELEKSIFNFITSHTNASTKDIAEAVGVTVRTVQRSIKELESHEVIKKAGKRNKIEWIILM